MIQCELRRGTTHQVAFLPDAHARLGSVLRLKGDGDGWRVMRLGAVVPDVYVLAHRDDYRTAFASLR